MKNIEKFFLWVTLFGSVYVLDFLIGLVLRYINSFRR